MQKEIIGQFVKNMMELGLGKKEIVKSLEEYLERGEDK